VGYLPRTGESVSALRDHERDSLFTRKVPNFRVLCPNRMIGMGQRRIEPSDDEAAKTAALWGPDPVHLTVAAYRVMTDTLESDMQNSDLRYTNPGNTRHAPKKARYDPSKE
jgi:hypothetical protein